MSLAEYLKAAGSAELSQLVAEDVRFHSPVADYRGRDDIVHMFKAIAALLDEVAIHRVITDDLGSVSFLTASVEGNELSGVLDERLDPEGIIVEATLLLRPYATLKIAIQRMAELLAESPRPGGPA
jgi:hypothetical protein